jgi:selenocysteine lyase/cysteine desulfurase
MADSDRVKILTRLDGNFAGGIGLIHIDGIDVGKLGGWLLDKYKIVSTPIGHAEFTGLRVTPNVYTTLDEVDTFIGAMREAIKKGVA